MSVTRGNIPADSFTGTVTRHLIQNPNSSLPKNTHKVSDNLSSHSTNLLAIHHHLADIAPDGKSRASEFIEQPLGSSRWNPTPDQLLALEEMYLSGCRTPSAEQIQHIASQLRRFGKIEGKNVFYWFQNHKARERQKRRRREMETNNSEEKKHIAHHNISADNKESGLRKTSYDIEKTKNCSPSSNCSKHTEEFVSMHRDRAVAEESTSCGPHYGWTQFDDERELQQRKSSTGTTSITAAAEVMNATWQKMALPSLEYKKLLKTDHRNLSDFSLLNIMKPYHQENGETQTLELFPLHTHSRDDGNSTAEDPITVINDTNNSCHYIEFLPLKN